jgi:hypothetical protein
MPTVPWIRLYQNWPRHRKTIALRKALGTAEPILCLWLWAAENAPNGDLEGMTTEDVETAADWHGKRGKAAMSMIEVGFIDVVPETGMMKLHNWEERAGRGVASLLKGRERARNVMRNVRANVSRNTTGNGQHNNTETLLLSPDLDLSLSGSLSAPDRARSNVNAKSSHDWYSYFATRYWEKVGKQYGRGESDAKATGSLGTLLESLPEAQRAEDWLSKERIVGEFLARDDPRTVAAGWSFSFFVQDFRGLALGGAKTRQGTRTEDMYEDLSKLPGVRR